MTKTSLYIRKLVSAALCLALALVLPLLTGQIPQVGSMLSPMHIPVFLCGFICGWPWGLAVGFGAPLLRYVIFSMPPMPVAIPMAFELAAYGLVTGVLSRRMPKRTAGIYGALVAAMVVGRLVWGAVSYVLAGLQGTDFTLALFLSGAFVQAVPGILLHLILVPLIVTALRRGSLLWNE